jgi:formylglycine-generating enzyme required for sulfatase activity
VLGIVLSASLLSLSPAGDGQEPPPGLVLVKGGKTKIGSTPDEIEKIVLVREELRNAVAGETPQHVEEVRDFYLMPTEVTNEQYAEFVKATRAKPPRSWGVKALLTGQAAFLDEQGKAKQEAKAAGKPFEAKVFEPELWWEEHWKEAQWEIPPEEATFPVVFVNYAEAQRYARWAGLRLMTELEYQRAARGDSERVYPWGNEWDDKKYCQSLHIGKDLAAPVGSYPEGAVDGIFDLAGNVWEWTASPFNQFPGYKALRFQDKKKRPIECFAPFDPNQRVIVSGSFQMDKVGVRLTTRKNADRVQSTNALGFRCAASTVPGQDMAQWDIDQELKLSTLGHDSQLDPLHAFTLRRWTTTTGKVQVPGYAIVTGFEQILACPVESIRGSSPTDLAATTVKEGPAFVGFIEVPRPLVHPELDAGIYFVAWRGAGKLEVKEPEPKQGIYLGGQDQEAQPLTEIPGFVAEKDCYIFFSQDGVPQVAFEAPPVTAERMREYGSIKSEPFVPPDPKTLPKDAPPPTPIDTLRFTFAVASATSKAKGLIFDLPLKVAPGTYDSSWK